MEIERTLQNLMASSKYGSFSWVYVEDSSAAHKDFTTHESSLIYSLSSSLLISCGKIRSVDISKRNQYSNKALISNELELATCIELFNSARFNTLNDNENLPVHSSVKWKYASKSCLCIHSPLLPAACSLNKMTYSRGYTMALCCSYEYLFQSMQHLINKKTMEIILFTCICFLSKSARKCVIANKTSTSIMKGTTICKWLTRVVGLHDLTYRSDQVSIYRDSSLERGDGGERRVAVTRLIRGNWIVCFQYDSKTMRLRYLPYGSTYWMFSRNGRLRLIHPGVVAVALLEYLNHVKKTNGRLCSSPSIALNRAQWKKTVGSSFELTISPLVLFREGILFGDVQRLSHLGKNFSGNFRGISRASLRTKVGASVLRNYVFVHLQKDDEKYNLLIFMLQKLFALVDHTAAPDNLDALQNQEVLLPGHLIAIYLKEKLQEWLYKTRKLFKEELQKNGENFESLTGVQIKKFLDKNPSKNVGMAIENMLKTGRIVTQSGIDLQQSGGMTVAAERLNFLRFISHFRSVHRGAAFAGQRNTSVRKLLPEAWGFLCPVHTPDGEPCGLLNHMASTCRITSFFDSQGNMKDFLKIRLSILNILAGIGMIPSLPKLVRAGPPEVLSVLLDGCVVGSISSDIAEKAVSHLRKLKLFPSSGIPEDLEVGYVPLSFGGAYPGLYLFTTPSRFLRPVRNISVSSNGLKDIELIGPFEQAYMEILCPDGGNGGRRDGFPATHEEIHPTGMLSVVANLTPFSDHNQSPRNMYQCQMAKQTMAFSSQALRFRADQKLYHLQTPQTPIVRTAAYSKYHIDEFPTGTNAIVAVLAYTGFDMEDAMILNKSSVERGMFHGTIYQVETIDLEDQKELSDQAQSLFARSNIEKHSSIDADGLPYVGQMLHPDEPYYSVHNTVNNSTKTFKLKGSEPVIVDYVAVDKGTKQKPPQKANNRSLQYVNIRFRRPRNPIIGDKFSSRHGQKGVCSQLWPDIDMPFSGVTGIRPDLIINPHAFPSRMTIGMLLESIAAKGGSLSGAFVDATPFPGALNKAGEESSDSRVDELGPLLASYGFNYHGLEVLYSGVLGTELTCEIFIGPVYYQRLRHMVSDKFQVRSTGTVDQVTRQPIKGRKRGGGIRFGEMERDAMLAHGAAYLLHDRLHTCSDHHIADVCSLCGSILTATIMQPLKKAIREIGGLPPGSTPKKITCHACKTSKGMETVAMPYVFKYLAAELAAMNVKMTLRLGNGAEA
ncbi:hypothetical protein Syun_031219 [Stephania yunnanensis]|uniref:DNA-directed RNA polymerase subunit beta n=1 Tax=Stephania yunnanensis TaxID=152371 RepID=A0AAP0E335_9MAGN